MVVFFYLTALRICWHKFLNYYHDYIVWRKAWRQLHNNAASNIELVLEVALHKAAAVRPLTTHHENYPS